MGTSPLAKRLRQSRARLNRVEDNNTGGIAMASWADEISAIIERNIAGFDESTTSTASVGTVIAVQDGVARVYGLQDVKYLELVEFPRSGLMGLAFNLEEETVSCTIMGDYTQVREDDEV